LVCGIGASSGRIEEEKLRKITSILTFYSRNNSYLLDKS
jgi:hypothetical protein